MNASEASTAARAVARPVDKLAAYPKVTERGRPSGEERLLSVSEPVVRDGLAVAWDAVFDLNRPDHHYYLVSGGHWQDAEGSGVQQYANWAFHV